MLLNLSEVVLIALLGFMPLIIVHWADRQPKLRLPRLVRVAFHALIAFKTSALVELTDWATTIML